jgi:rhamnogalacturonyl hydrolase YesR
VLPTGIEPFEPVWKNVLWVIFHPIDTLQLLDEAQIDRDVWKKRTTDLVSALAEAKYGDGK